MRARLFITFIAIVLALGLGLGLAENSLQSRYNPVKMAEKRDNSIFFPLPEAGASTAWQREGGFINVANFQRRGFDHILDNESYGPDGSGRKRLLLVGDSFVYGTGVANPDDMLGQRLEDELNHTVGRDAFDVQTLALHGASTLEESEWLTDELLTKIDPDLIVVGLVPNDAVPSGRESTLCGSDLFCEESLTAIDIPEYSACLSGERGLLPRIVRYSLMPFFPLVSEVILSRHCDLDRFSAESGVTPYGELTPGSEKDPLMKLFYEGIGRLAEINADIPVTVTPLYTNPNSFPTRHGLSEEIREKGLVVADMPLSSDAYKRLTNPRTFWANPVDGHPNRYLNELYAKDIVATLLRNHPWVLDAPSGSQGLPAVVSGFLPLGGKVRSSNDLFFSGVLTSENMITRGMLLNDGTMPAEQKTPCAILGRVHGALYLRSGLPEGQRVELSYQRGPDPVGIVEVYTLQVEHMSNGIIRKVGELRAGISLMITLEAKERTIMFAPRNSAECGDSESKLLLPPIGVDLSLR